MGAFVVKHGIQGQPHTRKLQDISGKSWCKTPRLKTLMGFVMSNESEVAGQAMLLKPGVASYLFHMLAVPVRAVFNWQRVFAVSLMSKSGLLFMLASRPFNGISRRVQLPLMLCSLSLCCAHILVFDQAIQNIAFSDNHLAFILLIFIVLLSMFYFSVVSISNV